MNLFEIKDLCISHKIGDSDHLDFAEFTNDFNPMHMDDVYARKTQAGQPVVHGIHLLIWALDEIANVSEIESEELEVKCDFNKFVYVNSSIRLEHKKSRNEKHTFTISSNNIDCLKITLIAHREKRSEFHEQLDPIAITNLDGNDVKPIVTNTNAAKSFHESYSLNPTSSSFLDRFPKLTELVGKQTVTGICLTSTVIGMRCPGLHSIYSGIHFFVKTDGSLSVDQNMHVQTESVDHRFGLLNIKVITDKLQGSLTSFYRQPPVESPSVSTMKHLENHDLKDKNVLIIGGSRGLGESLAKLTALSDANVYLTYFRGENEALEITKDVTKSCKNANIKATRLDIFHDYDEQLKDLSTHWDFVFYLATPKIFVQKSDLFDYKLYQSFTDYYINRFYALLEYLKKHNSGIAAYVYYPSSVAIDQRPEDMTEYAMTKNAAELLINDFNKSSHSSVQILSSRLPRFESDQTATVSQTEAESAISVAQGILNLMHSKTLNNKPISATA